MEHEFQIFNIVSENDELVQEFHNFFYKYNLTPLFTNEHRAGHIRVSDNEVRATVNTHGAYHKTLKDFGDFLSMANDNKSYEEALFKIIYESKTMQGMVNKIKKLMEYIQTGIDNDHMFNLWNIVWYNKGLF